MSSMWGSSVSRRTGHNDLEYGHKRRDGRQRMAPRGAKTPSATSRNFLVGTPLGRLLVADRAAFSQERWSARVHQGAVRGTPASSCPHLRSCPRPKSLWPDPVRLTRAPQQLHSYRCYWVMSRRDRGRHVRSGGVMTLHRIVTATPRHARDVPSPWGGSTSRT